jgi:hypothetical protein
MKCIFFILGTLLTTLASAQDLTGIWRGSFNSSEKIYDILNVSDRYKFEVQIDNLNKKFTGVTYSYKTTVFYGKAVAVGTVNPATGKVMLQETKIVELKMSQNSGACVMTCFLQYSKNGEEEFLEGKYISYNEKDSSFCGRGTVLLRKVMTSDFYKEPFIVKREEENERKKAAKIRQRQEKSSPPVVKATIPKNNPKTAAGNSTGNVPSKDLPEEKPLQTKPNPEIAKIEKPSNTESSIKRSETVPLPKPLATRANELLKTIVVNTNDITINVYDNGTIDHDTISIFVDKKLVISKQMLTTSPITVKLKLNDEIPYHELVMVAENLGDIPPNTSLMVVKAGDKEYEVRITSTEQKNAVIIFKFEK